MEKPISFVNLAKIIGGMPKSILEYIQTKSLFTVPDVQNKIINDYIADMAKYASNTESIKIRAAFNSIPIQLAKENKKFKTNLLIREVRLQKNMNCFIGLQIIPQNLILCCSLMMISFP